MKNKNISLACQPVTMVTWTLTGISKTAYDETSVSSRVFLSRHHFYLSVCKLITDLLTRDFKLQDCFDSEEFLALSIDEKTKRFNLFWFNFEHHKLRQVDFTPSAEDEIAKSCVLFRIKATLTVGFEHSDVKSG